MRFLKVEQFTITTNMSASRRAADHPLTVFKEHCCVSDQNLWLFQDKKTGRQVFHRYRKTSVSGYGFSCNQVNQLVSSTIYFSG